MMSDRSDEGSRFFEKNYSRVHAYVWSMVRDANEAEDLTQEAFLRAQREREMLKDPKAMRSWLFSGNGDDRQGDLQDRTSRRHGRSVTTGRIPWTC